MLHEKVKMELEKAEILKTVKCGRFNVTVRQVKMSEADREIENSRIRKQFIMAQS